MKKILLFLSILLFNINYAQSDCATSTALCGGSNINYTPTGNGSTPETLGGCLTSNEHFSVWYTFTVATTGTLTFVIQPYAHADYDWAIYGPDVDCDNRGNPIRCSYAGTAPGTNTGLSLTSQDVWEDPTTDSLGNAADGFVKHLDVQAGETYILIVDNFSANASGFELVWGGTATLASPFTDPNLAPNPFLQPGQNGDENVYLCSPLQVFDFATLTSRIINGNPNYVVEYYMTANDAATETNAISAPMVPILNTDYHYVIRYSDPVDPNSAVAKCREYGTFKFRDASFTLVEQEITVCKPYNSNSAVFDLTSVSNYNGTQTMTITYYPTLQDAENKTNEILTPQSYNASAGIAYVRYENEYECVKIGKIHLQFFPVIQTSSPTVTRCFITEKLTKGLFDLTIINVNNSAFTVTKKYYTSLSDAIDDTNPIDNPAVYESEPRVIYVRATDPFRQCWTITTITLKVTAPTYSTVLKDQMICLEDRATLDAGVGFDGYTWSTGATTQTISDVKVGEYWVDLLKNGCITRQKVRVHAVPSPVIKRVEITNNVATVNVEGGKAPYEFSIDGQSWQSSNVLTNLKRGDVKIYVRDSYGCLPIITTITVPNFINAITPNGDGMNDVIDYSALRHKKNLTFKVFDRYGTMVYEAIEANFYMWDGKSGNKKLNTDTYWYVMTWEEINGTVSSYSGWVMLKNH